MQVIASGKDKFVPRAMIYVRSMKQVGGSRPESKYTRKKKKHSTPIEGRVNWKELFAKTFLGKFLASKKL